jgi:hypothetical protein
MVNLERDTEGATSNSRTLKLKTCSISDGAVAEYRDSDSDVSRNLFRILSSIKILGLLDLAKKIGYFYGNLGVVDTYQRHVVDVAPFRLQSISVLLSLESLCGAVKVRIEFSMLHPLNLNHYVQVRKMEIEE